MDEFDLRRFVDAQNATGTYELAIRELRSGRKTSHWMWFVFPQIAGLGSSAMAQRYAISGLDEARAYLDHALLGPRLRECVKALLELPGTNAVTVFGPIDAMKLRSSMTLFHLAAPDDPGFRSVLDRYFDGEDDPETRRLV